MYYPNSDFLNSISKSVASYMWKSIWAAKKVLQDGVCWHVGTGSRISVSSDVWVLGASNFRLSHSVINGSLLTVDQLIDNHNRKWKSDLVNYTFNIIDAECIL